MNTELQHIANNNKVFSIVEDIEDWVKTLVADYALNKVEGEQFLIYTQQIKDIITQK